MKQAAVWLAALLALGAATGACSEVRFGPLPEGEVSRSHMGPADEFILYIAFDPAPFQAALPEGTSFLRLDQVARREADVAAYVQAHPERAGWAWSYFEIIGLQEMAYDGVKARLGRDGGMAVWYATLRRTDRSDPRPKGYSDLALGSWLSDPGLVRHMRARGYPIEAARVMFRRDAGHARGRLEAEGLRVEARCRLHGEPFTPDWGGAEATYETVWTPRTLAPTFEVLSWGGHKEIACADPVWTFSGRHPLARAFAGRPIGGPRLSGTEFATGYMVQGALYRRP